MDGESSLKKAYEAILGGDFEQAIARFEEAIALEPDNAAAYYRCSITCARSGKWSKALQYAEQAALLDPGQEEYEFHLRTVRAKLLADEAEELLTGQPEEAERALSEQLAGWCERYPDVAVRRVVMPDEPARQLLAQAEAAQLVVVGNRGRGGFAGMLLGSVSSAVVHSATAPVIVARQPN